MKSIATSMLVAATFLCVSLASASSQTHRPKIAPWGFDLAGMDRSLKPGDDFFRYGGGAWMRNTPIPQDRSSWGPFFILRANAEADVKTIVEAHHGKIKVDSVVGKGTNFTLEFPLMDA